MVIDDDLGSSSNPPVGLLVTSDLETTLRLLVQKRYQRRGRPGRRQDLVPMSEKPERDDEWPPCRSDRSEPHRDHGAVEEDIDLVGRERTSEVGDFHGRRLRRCPREGRMRDAPLCRSGSSPPLTSSIGGPRRIRLHPTRPSERSAILPVVAPPLEFCVFPIQTVVSADLRKRIGVGIVLLAIAIAPPPCSGSRLSSVPMSSRWSCSASRWRSTTRCSAASA